MIPQHWFWWALVMVCVAWYGVITFIVAYKGARDIREMIGRLSGNQPRRRERV